MVGVIDGFRWCILGGRLDADAQASISISFIMSIVILIVAVRYFRKAEKRFADII
jgi:lipopolysaccharide transport system permease protein